MDPERGATMGKQETRGKIKNIKGRVKESVGILTGNTKLEREGSRERTAGAVQQSVGKARRKVGEFVAGVAKTIKK